jgi:hypothetical protein
MFDAARTLKSTAGKAELQAMDRSVFPRKYILNLKSRPFRKENSQATLLLALTEYTGRV